MAMAILMWLILTDLLPFFRKIENFIKNVYVARLLSCKVAKLQGSNLQGWKIVICLVYKVQGLKM